LHAVAQLHAVSSSSNGMTEGKSDLVSDYLWAI